MGDDENIFVKRVDFEVNNNEPDVTSVLPLIINGDMKKNDDLENEKEKKLPTTCCGKFNRFLEKFGIKAALSHIGLLLGLALYCLLGGYVSNE